MQQYLPRGKFENVTPARSRMMSAIKGRGNRTTEQRLRLAFVRAGIRGWRVHASDLPGRPDFFFFRSRVAVFVDGCFWHGCACCGHTPKTNPRFWAAKIEGNRQRDRKVARHLNCLKIKVIRFWEHQLTQNLTVCIEKVIEAIAPPHGRGRKRRGGGVAKKKARRGS
ncbi:MAG: very short patch repair endonuclease [Planctomycetia bacterium]|nr:very short patch repair endonuclease [Planctomycetia bacterium]